jgi:signal transduction histidine kinase
VTDDARSRAAALRQRTLHTGPLNKRLSSLIKISQALAGPGTLDELVESVAREVCEHLMADQVFFLLQDAHGALHVRSEYPRDGARARTSVSGSVCDEAMRGDALFIPEAANDPRFQGQESVQQLNLRSVMVAPVTPVGSGVPTGLLYACTYSPDGQIFGEEDLELLKALASQVSIHLDRTRVLAEKERLLGELRAVAASRGRVVEVATHELGTPIQQVWLALFVAQKHAERLAAPGIPQPEDKAELAAALRRAVDGMHGLRARFIDPFRAYQELELLIDRLAPAPVAQRAIDLMLARWRDMAGDHRLQAFERLPVAVRADAVLLERALTNLVANAFAYSPAGSLVAVEAIREGDTLAITVRDEGMGIPEKDLPHLGTWLYRAENAANLATVPPGMGMGLYAARRIAEAHGGTLAIESELGKGTRVSLRLPAFVESVDHD